MDDDDHVSCGIFSLRESLHQESPKLRQNSQYILEVDETESKESSIELASPIDADFSKIMSIVDEGLDNWELACTGDVTSYKKVIMGQPVVLMKSFTRIEGMNP